MKYSKYYLIKCSIAKLAYLHTLSLIWIIWPIDGFMCLVPFYIPDPACPRYSEPVCKGLWRLSTVSPTAPNGQSGISDIWNIRERSHQIFTVSKGKHSLPDSLVVHVECWLRVREVPGSIPSQGPRHTKDVIKMVPVVPLSSAEH